MESPITLGSSSLTQASTPTSPTLTTSMSNAVLLGSDTALTVTMMANAGGPTALDIIAWTGMCGSSGQPQSRPGQLAGHRRWQPLAADHAGCQLRPGGDPGLRRWGPGQAVNCDRPPIKLSGEMANCSSFSRVREATRRDVRYLLRLRLRGWWWHLYGQRRSQRGRDHIR